MTKTRREIDLLREYRTRLVSDVVTGKLDVRGIELPALDDVDKIETLPCTDDIEADSIDEAEELAYADD
jgi:type I restriction enzyme, S subunit